MLQFVACFNRGEFWESHEVLEPAWQRTRSPFYHGLILYASAWVHARRRNPHGVVAQISKATPLLEQYRPVYLGIDVERLLADGRRLLTQGQLGELQAEWQPSLATPAGLITGTEPELADSG